MRQAVNFDDEAFFFRTQNLRHIYLWGLGGGIYIHRGGDHAALARAAFRQGFHCGVNDVRNWFYAVDAWREASEKLTGLEPLIRPIKKATPRSGKVRHLSHVFRENRKRLVYLEAV